MAESHIFGPITTIRVDPVDGPPPIGATHGQVIALAVYIAPDGPNGERGAVHYPPPAGTAANAVALEVVWAGHPSVGRGGKAWEG